METSFTVIARSDRQAATLRNVRTGKEIAASLSHLAKWNVPLPQWS
jgi:hypothetical protein